MTVTFQAKRSQPFLRSVFLIRFSEAETFSFFFGGGGGVGWIVCEAASSGQ